MPYSQTSSNVARRVFKEKRRSELSSSISLYRIAKNVPLLRGLTHQECPYHTGSVIENRLGLQLGKMLGKYMAWRLRKSRVTTDIQDHVNVLRRDGVLVIPDFLTDEDFSRIREEFERARPELAFVRFKEVESGRLEVARLPIGDHDDFAHTRRHLQDNLLIQRVVSAVIKRAIKVKPSITINVYRLADIGAPDNDVENLLHADLHTPTAKAFYYLNDVDETNGAFVYAKGTHKLSFGRLKHEYDLSVRTAKLKRGDTDIPDHLVEARGPNKRNIIAERYLREMGVVETQICRKANSLVIANNLGFHRRGEFTGGRPRETIQINFRNLERPF